MGSVFSEPLATRVSLCEIRHTGVSRADWGSASVLFVQLGPLEGRDVRTEDNQTLRVC